jgi:hypothetical protein
MRLIDADALIQTEVHTVVVLKDGREQLESVLYAEQVDDAPTVEPASPWHRVEDELPDDGGWEIFKNGKVVTVERFKKDAYNHFFPVSNWFDFEDAIAWMPLPELSEEDA